jgi:hypothetical protein
MRRNRVAGNTPVPNAEESVALFLLLAMHS